MFKADPFQSLDQEGVGLLIKMAIEKGRSVRKNLKVGICGEHGGDLNSVKFCHRVGMNYVSSSPYRVPVSRLAAAQAVIEDKVAAAKAKTAGKSTPRKSAAKSLAEKKPGAAKAIVKKPAATKTTVASKKTSAKKPAPRKAK